MYQLRTLYLFSPLLFLIVLTACTTFDSAQMRSHIISQLPPRDTSDTVIAGEVMTQFKALHKNDDVFIAWYDSTNTLRIDSAVVSLTKSTDTSIALRESSSMFSTTMHVALRNVGGIYRIDDHPEFRHPDEVRTVSGLFAIPFLIFFGTMGGYALGARMNSAGSGGYLGEGAGGALIGFIFSIIACIALI